MQIHESVTLDRVMEAIEVDDMLGFCIACGEERDCCEPDMRGGPCEECNTDNVYGAEELLFYMA